MYIQILRITEILAETISSFSSKLGIDIVAEFVHNEAVCNKVKEMGIKYSQGYYFSEPKFNIFNELEEA